MTTATQAAPAAAEPDELYNGDHMTQPQFHRIYSRMKDGVKAELIGGIVYMASPLKIRHGKNHFPLGSVLFAYESSTPGVECCDNTTVILGSESEPQPDIYLRILPECGGQSGTTDEDYVDGAPEFVAEVASSSLSIDLNAKRRDYARYGVREYLVLNLRDHRFHWFDLVAGVELSPNAGGVMQSRSFPGLWIDGPAVLARDFGRMIATLDAGLATPDHAAFAAKLAAAKKDTP